MNDDVIIIRDKLLDKITNQGITHTTVAFHLGTLLLFLWALLGMWAVGFSLWHAKEPPSWAVGVES